MDSKIVAALLTSFVLILTACGSSSSNNDNNLKTDEDIENAGCSSDMDSQECYDVNNEADRIGLARFDSSSACGCGGGEAPVMYQGVRRCESASTTNYFGRSQTYVRYTRTTGKKGRSRSSLVVSDRRYTEGGHDSWATSSAGCGGVSGATTYAEADQDYATRCTSHDQCGEYQSNSRCAQISGESYGYCN